MIYLKIYNSLNGKIVTLCDEELLGVKLKENGLELYIGDFYKGELISENDFDRLNFEKVISIHAIGEKSINLLKNKGIIKKEDEKYVKYIQGIPVVLIFYV